MIETDADRLAMLEDAGERVTVAGVGVYVIWDPSLVEGSLVGATGIAITGRSTDLAGLTEVTPIVRGGVTYHPIPGSVDDDGTGMTQLRVRRAA